MISSVNVYTNLFQRREVKDNVCYRFSRQMHNWKLPHVNSPLSLWEKPSWQHTIFTEVMDRNLSSIKSSRLAVFLKLNLCENKRKRTLVKIPSIFSKFVSEQQEEEQWKEADFYTAFTRYWLDVTCHILDIYQNWRCLIEKRISRHVWFRAYLRWSHILPNSKLILKFLVSAT